MTQGNGLGDAYTATLGRVKAQRGNRSVLGFKVLMWVLYSERPLRTDELCHALGVEIGSTDLDTENVPALRTLVSSSLGLVTVEASSSTVRLVHFTLQEHLLSDPTLFHSPHSAIAEVCLTYLLFKSVCDLPLALRSAPGTMPLLEYASYYWGEHARRGVIGNAKILALKFLDRFAEHISLKLLFLRRCHDSGTRYLDEWAEPTRFTRLHGAAFFGIVEIVVAIFEMKGSDVNAADFLGDTALILAAERGHEEVVKMLLEREDVDPDQAGGEYGQTPFLWAAMNGHSGVVKMLLERGDVNPDHVGTQYGRTALSFAAENGHSGVVKMLLEREGVNPDHVGTQYGRTALSLAAGSGHSGVVKILLEREDVNPDWADAGWGRTPLSWAAGSGHSGVVKILLEREDVNPDQADTRYGLTPLSWAAKNGREGMVKMLLERKDVNPDHIDTRHGRTPLGWAAKNGHEGVVKMLLEREDVNPDHVDIESSQTPLGWAAANEHEGVVKMLLKRKGIHTAMSDCMDQTPTVVSSLIDPMEF